ncbi:hypothetical protein GCK72_008447 [Caenorhabditis remanei]|uniref:Uncharacterized protein n=1 Tax=Caenorhabditis remanei TaxID=31234 RepID=A0A6A5GZR7_CAERE|nr:hypothetical protein GCK72_008447 [Caenorhabditis remanei]KAF1760201.1 hypothetical protein GCK72_008447 [Caenorhabditis remanei]
MLNVSTKDLMMDHQDKRKHSYASSISSSSFNDDIETTPQPISRRRDSLIEQFRDFLSRSVDFTFKIDNPFEKEMY